MPHRSVGAQHLVSEPAHNSLARAPGISAKGQAAQFAMCARSARTTDHTFEDWWSIYSVLQHILCSDDTSGPVQAIVVHWDREKTELECLLLEDLHQVGVQHS